jgi:hypothetical protein
MGMQSVTTNDNVRLEFYVGLDPAYNRPLQDPATPAGFFMRWYNATRPLFTPRSQAMRAVAGAIVFLAGIILWGAGHIAIELRVPHQSSNGDFAMVTGILTAIVGAVMTFKGWREQTPPPA